MPRGRPKKDPVEKTPEKRITIRFSSLDERHMMVFDYLKELPYGQKTDAIVNAICYRATEYHTMMTETQQSMEKVQRYIHEEIQRAIPEIASVVVDEMKKSGLVFSGSTAENATNEMPVNTSGNADKDDADMKSALEALSLAEMFA